jgi:hypothetical protein
MHMVNTLVLLLWSRALALFVTYRYTCRSKKCGVSGRPLEQTSI